jgi:hypothetical protein
MKRMRLACTFIYAVVCAGCNIPIELAQKSIDDLRAIEAKANDDAKQRIEQVCVELEKLIHEAKGGIIEVEDNFFVKLAKERKELLEGFLDAYAILSKDVDFKIDKALGPPIRLPAEFSELVKQAPKELQLRLLESAILLDPRHPVNPLQKLFNVDNLRYAEGTILTMQSKGRYQLTFISKNSADLLLSVGDREARRPAFSVGGRAMFEVPAEQLAQEFEDENENSILEKHVKFTLQEAKPGGPAKEAFKGDLILVPKFHVVYELHTTRNGRSIPHSINEGSAIIELMSATKTALEAQRKCPLDIAKSQGRLYALANKYLPCGYSEIRLPPDDSHWELIVQTGGRQKEHLNQEKLAVPGVRVITAMVQDEFGRFAKKLMIYVTPVIP